MAQLDGFNDDPAMDPPALDVQFADSRLPSLVRKYWEAHGRPPCARERVLPTADILVLVSLGAPHVIISEGRQRAYSDAISGIQERSIVAGAMGQADAWGAVLSPRGAQFAFGSVAAIAGSVHEFAAVLGKNGAALAGRLRDAPTFEARCAIFDAHIAKAIHAGRAKWRPEIEWMLAQAIESNVQVGTLAGAIGWSRKHLHEQMVSHIGHSPKTVIRVARFERALRIIGARAEVSLAEVAVEAGYYDQPQFTREFRALSGITPVDYLRSRVGDAQYGFVDADR